MRGETLWIIKKRDDNRFPYALTIQEGEDIILSLLVQDLWPGAGQNIFCLRAEDEKSQEEVERVRVVSLRRYGRKLSVVLDRPHRKRCYFLFLKKRYKTRPGEYEQIFWMTQSAITRRRPKVLLSTRESGQLEIRIDINERYPWRFPGSRVERGSLPVGDYALLLENQIISLIERKTFRDMLASFSNLPLLHQRLGELETYPYPALVIEANYQDFLSREKLKYFTPEFAAKAWAEISAFHPRLNIIFAGSRKLANKWVLKFFAAVSSHEKEPPSTVHDIILRYEGDRISYDPEYEIVEKIKELKTFTFKQLREVLPYYSPGQLRKVLRRLRKKGKVKISRSEGQVYWSVIDGIDKIDSITSAYGSTPEAVDKSRRQ